MLNIPETVKALYKRDGVNKNFRAHFPNGELPDITNENIVQETVKFQESVCSQDVFKFGLTEASVIEFEVVGVANMYGMTIQCFNEIDCSSLSAAEIAEIEAGEWDGEYVPLADSDLGYAFFRVPYGVFRVESCPRDHQAMAHRKVTAYTQMQTDTNDFEQKKDAILLFQKTYNPFSMSFVLGQLATSTPQMLLDFGYSVETVSMRTGPGSPASNMAYWSKEIRAATTGGGTIQISVFVNGKHAIGGVNYSSTLLTKYNLWQVDYSANDYDYDAFFASAVAALEDYGIDPIASGYANMQALASAVLPASTFPRVLYPAEKRNSVDIPHGQIVYPYRGDFTNCWLSYATSGSISFGSTAYQLEGFAAEEPTVKMFVPSNTADYFNFSFLPTLTQGKLNSFSDAFSLVDLANGWLELNGVFAAASRNGGNRIVYITNNSPVAVAPTDYSQMWWDEFDVQPIGTIRYAYTDEAGEEQVVEYQFGDGASIYDMTDNAVLKAMDGASPTIIESLLDTSFIPHLSAVNFTPLELEAKGLPYIEAGDALAVTAQDGTVCSSYALRRELDGVQVLTDQIDSQSGMIIDSEEGGT